VDGTGERRAVQRRALPSTGARPGPVRATGSGLDRPEIRRLAERAAAASTLVLTDELFEAVAPVDTPSGVLALVPIPPEPAAVPARGSCVVLESVQDAGNVGSILRSAAAAGVPLALLTRGCAQAWSPKVLRAAMGAHFSLGILEHADPAALLAAYPGAVVATIVIVETRCVTATFGGTSPPSPLEGQRAPCDAPLYEKGNRRS